MASEESGEDSSTSDRPEQRSVNPFPVTSRIDDLAEELRTVAGLRSRNAIRDRVFPTLLALLPEDCQDDPERRYAALQKLIEAGLAAMPDGDHRQAATALLAYDNGRWRPLTKRGSEAAAAFGLGWDAYRRRRDSTGSSLVVETMTELAGVLDGGVEPARSSSPATVAPVHLISGPTEEAIPNPNPTPTPTLLRPHRAVVMAVIALAVVGFAAGGYLYGTRATDEPVNCGNLTNAPGDHVDGAKEEISRWSDAFASTARGLPDGGSACAGIMSQRNGVVYQEISPGMKGGVSTLIVAADDRGEVVVLDHQEYFRYRAEAWDPEKPAPGIGVPVRRSDLDGGPLVVEFTNGILVKEDAEVPAVAVAGALWTRWLDEGGFDGRLGTPVSNVYDVAGDGRVQEFTDGNLEVDYRSGTVDVVEPPTTDLQLPDGYAGAILESRGTATSWFVDDDGIRHWLPTTNDFGCVKLFHKAEQFIDVPNAAIAQLPTGEAARCR